MTTEEASRYTHVYNHTTLYRYRGLCWHTTARAEESSPRTRKWVLNKLSEGAKDSEKRVEIDWERERVRERERESEWVSERERKTAIHTNRQTETETSRMSERNKRNSMWRTTAKALKSHLAGSAVWQSMLGDDVRRVVILAGTYCQLAED